MSIDKIVKDLPSVKALTNIQYIGKYQKKHLYMNIETDEYLIRLQNTNIYQKVDIYK